MVWDLNKPLELPDESVEAIAGMHVFEHLKSDIEAVVKSWYRVLKPEGEVVIEVPDIEEIAREIIVADEERRHLLLGYIYGNQEDEHNIHYWGWTKTSIVKLFDDMGFKAMAMEGKDYHTEEAPCLRLEAIK